MKVKDVLAISKGAWCVKNSYGKYLLDSFWNLGVAIQDKTLDYFVQIFDMEVIDIVALSDGNILQITVDTPPNEELEALLRDFDGFNGRDDDDDQSNEDLKSILSDASTLRAVLDDFVAAMKAYVTDDCDVEELAVAMAMLYMVYNDLNKKGN